MLNSFLFADINHKHVQCALFLKKILKTISNAPIINFPFSFDTKNLSNKNKNSKNIVLKNNIRSNTLNKKANIQD